MSNAPRLTNAPTALPAAASCDLVAPDQVAALLAGCRAIGLIQESGTVQNSTSAYAAQIAHELSEPRPCPRAGNPPKEVRALRAAIFQQHPELDSRREPALSGYVKNMCSVLGLLGYRAPMLEAVPELGQALAAQLKNEYTTIKELGIPPSAISRRAHLWTHQELQELVTRAPLLFDTEKGARPKSRMMIDIVMRGLYPDIDTLHSRYQQITAEAERVFGARADTAPVAGMAASLVVRKNRESIAECHQIYVKALKDGERISRRHRIFEPIVRTMAGFVMSGRYDSMAEAARVYRRLYADVEKQFAGSPDAEAISRTTVVLLIKGAYKSARHAHDRLQTIHSEMELEVGVNKDLASVARSLELLVYSKNYKTVAQVVKRYHTALASAEKLFEVDEFGRSLAKTAAHLVVQLRYKSALAVYRTYQRLMKEASAECGPDEEGAEVAKTLVMTVLKNTYPSIAVARDTYLVALADCEKQFKAVPSMARSAALLVLQKRFKDGADALRHYSACRRESADVLSDDPVTAPLVSFFAHSLFKEAISSIHAAKARYLEIFADCNARFNAHPDSPRITRTATLLVFRRVYPNAEAAHVIYLDHLEHARAEHGHLKEESGQDVPGVRSMAMKLFESRIHSLAA